MEEGMNDSRFIRAPPQEHGEKPFYYPEMYKDFVLAGKGAGNLGYVKIFNSPDKSWAIVVKKFTNPFDSQDRTKLVLRELNLLRTIKHENVLKLIGCYTLESGADSLVSIYHITEYCGLPLSEYIKAGNYTMADVKKWTREVLLGVQHLHSNNVIHRHLHPGNVCVNGDNKLTLIGFGMARLVRDQDVRLTANRGNGTHSAIELLRKWKGRYNEKVDIWSISAILCELITGQAIFEDAHNNTLLQHIKYLGAIGPAVLDMIDDAESHALAQYQAGKVLKPKNMVEAMHAMVVPGRKITKSDLADQQYPLKDFLDNTLQFNPDHRMHADYALSHQFLLPPQPWESDLPEDPAQAMKELRGHIFDEIREASIFS